MRKNRIVFLCVFVMLAAMLAGCNKVPTAEELVTKFLETKLETADMDVLMVIEMSAEAEGMSAEMSLEMDTNMKTNKEVSYMQGKVTIDMLGMEVSQDMETWGDLTNNMTYTYNSMYDCWISAEATEVTYDEEAQLDVELFGELVMAEVTDEATEYVVTTTLNLGDVYELVGMNMGELLEGTEGLDLENMTMDVTMKFDRETERLSSIAMAADENALASISDGETRCTAMIIEIVYNEVDKEITLEIPATVIEEAVSVDEMMEMLQGLY